MRIFLIIHFEHNFKVAFKCPSGLSSRLLEVQVWSPEVGSGLESAHGDSHWSQERGPRKCGGQSPEKL